MATRKLLTDSWCTGNQLTCVGATEQFRKGSKWFIIAKSVEGFRLQALEDSVVVNVSLIQAKKLFINRDKGEV